VNDSQNRPDFKPPFRLRPLIPGDDEFDAARRLWNGLHDPHPAAIVRCSTTSETVAALAWARANSLPIAVRGGGHSFPGYGSVDDGVVLDLSPLAQVEVDTERRVARVGGGATWAQVDAATAAAGLAVPGGLVSSTGVGGLTLGGGIGWLSRAWGLACDQIVAAEMVLADGSVRHVDQTSEPELLWAIRGGGGNFGVVTRFDFQLHELPPGGDVLGGMVLYDASAADELLREYARISASMPESLSTLIAFINVPPLPFLPEALHFAPAVAIALCDLGEPGAAEARSLPLRRLATPLADLVQRLPYVGQQQLFDAGAPAGLRQYGLGANLGGLSDEAIAALCRQAAARPTPLCQMHLHQLGGAVARVAEDETAYAGRDAAWVLNIIATWNDPNEDERARSWARETRQQIRAHAAPRTYLNFLGESGSEEVQQAYGAAKHRRLRQLKRRFDPDNLFRRNANIAPSD
jgi:FAD/FMN-containing dehydrogenase